MGTGFLRNHGLSEIDALLRRGAFSEVQERLATSTESAAFIARARVAIFHDANFVIAEELCDEIVRRGEGADVVLYGRALRALARANAGKEIERFDIADISGIARDVIGEIVYFIALAIYSAGGVREADRWLTLHEPSSPDLSARFDILRGYVAAAREQFVEQATLCARAVNTLIPLAHEESYVFANAVRAYAIVARDVPVVDDVDLEGLFPKLSPDFAASRFHTLRGMAWLHSLHGEHQQGLKCIVRAASEARRPVEHLYAHLDHATLALFNGEGHVGSARAAFEVAIEFADAVAWDEVRSDDLAALPLAAQVAADLGATDVARRFYQLAERLRGNIAPRFALAHDGRFDGYVEEAIALTEANDDRSRAVEAAGRAYATFSRIGFAWRAARMAIVLHQITREMSWRDNAAEHLSHYRSSPFELYVQPNRFRERALTLRQREVFDLALAGFNRHQIGERLGISSDTVRIHLGRLYRHFGVKNLIGLLSKFRVSA